MAADWTPCIAPLLLSGGGLIAAWIHAAKLQVRRQVLASVASARGGEVLGSGWFQPLVVAFPFDDAIAELSFVSGEDACTRLQVLGPAPCTLRIVPEGVFHQIGKFFGGQDIQVGDETFDRAFLIQGESEERVKQILQRETRARLRRLANLGSPRRSESLRIEAGQPGITIRIGTCLVDNRETLGRFLDDALEVIRQVRGPRADVPAVKFLDAPAASSGGDCPVCGQAMTAAVSVCKKCRTPHHTDCWEYFGGCAVYACRSHRATRRSARSGSPS